jgi:16S rRNA (cytidine1402-2'-O)-methyltransferase
MAGEQSLEAGLYLVATPIGNLEDITFRAIRVLKQADLIACEDTRQTQKLLNHYEIDTPTISYHEHNEAERSAELIENLAKGETIAVVSDAGMPGISDPGFRLISLAIERGLPVIPVPGAVAFIAALVASGLPAESFCFRGFLPPKAGARRRALEQIQQASHTELFYEAPHRILEALEDAVAVLGPQRKIVVARELTKLHEEILRGSAGEVLDLVARRGELKGEITLLIGPAEGEILPAGQASIRERVEQIMREHGCSQKDALKKAARERGIAKSAAYREWQRR